MSYLTDRAPWFAFLVHPRDVPDFIAMPGGSLVRDHSADDDEFVAKASSNPPMVLADIVFGGSGVRGELIGVGRLPHVMLTPDGHRAVVEGVELAVQRGAPVIGLGALTAPATAGGRALLRRLPAGVVVTNGNGLTAAVVRANVAEAAAWLGSGTDARVAVLGATGSVGTALAHLLADDGYELVLAGSSHARVTRLLGGLLERGARAAEGTSALTDADIVVVLTSEPSAKLAPELVCEGAVVIDVAQPCNVADEERPAFAARGAQVVRGGVVRIPGYACKQDFGLPSRRDTFACLAETYLLACEGLREHSVGRPSADYARRMARLAERRHVTVRPLALGDAGDLSRHVEDVAVAASTEGG